MPAPVASGRVLVQETSVDQPEMPPNTTMSTILGAPPVVGPPDPGGACPKAPCRSQSAGIVTHDPLANGDVPVKQGESRKTWILAGAAGAAGLLLLVASCVALGVALRSGSGGDRCVCAFAGAPVPRRAPTCVVPRAPSPVPPGPGPPGLCTWVLPALRIPPHWPSRPNFATGGVRLRCKPSTSR